MFLYRKGYRNGLGQAQSALTVRVFKVNAAVLLGETHHGLVIMEVVFNLARSSVVQVKAVKQPMYCHELKHLNIIDTGPQHKLPA